MVEKEGLPVGTIYQDKVAIKYLYSLCWVYVLSFMYVVNVIAIINSNLFILLY